jgi:hypothetical protein
MAKRDDVFPSKYLRASDLNGKPLVVVIASAELETMKTPEGKMQPKTVLTFRGIKKSLPLNRTNWDKVADITGKDDSDDWPGDRLELFPTTTEMKGETVDCIRVRKPDQPALPLKQRPAAKKAAPAKPLTDDMDDEIPWN